MSVQKGRRSYTSLSRNVHTQNRMPDIAAEQNGDHKLVVNMLVFKMHPSRKESYNTMMYYTPSLKVFF